MPNCVNRSSLEFQALSEKSNINPIILAAKVSLWQEQNGLDNFPTIEDLSTTKTSSKASPETIIRVKEAAEKMGIKMLELNEYLKGNPEVKVGGINGLADLTQKTIAIAQGHEDTTLTEEVVHMATAILEQTNPKLITELISKIDRFKIYKQTFDTYKNLKAYQLSNGKPDIRKIKKEAVDKLISEVIINQSEGSEQFPELMKEAERNLISSWWNTIMDYLRGVYRKTNIDIFEKAATKVLNPDGTVSEITSTGVFYQKNEAVDKIYDTIINHDKEMELNPETPNDKRHYTFQGNKVDKSVTEKVKAESPFNPADRTELEKIYDESKREWGSKGHEFIEEYISTNLIDKDGYKLSTPNSIPIKNTLTMEQVKVLKEFSKNLIDSYKPGTRFIVERKVVDTKVKGMLASTVDFVAIEPDEKTGFKIDTLDWKFTTVDKNTSEDIPWFKQKEWKQQMGHYTKIWQNYGANPNQIRKARMVPFIANYYPVDLKDKKKGLRMTSLEVGNLNDITKTELHLLPVPLNSESTDNPKIDSLLNQLRIQYEKLYKTPTSPEEKFAKDIKLNEISKAIRSLHMKLDFEPLVNIGKDFLDNAANILKELKGLDYSTMSKEEVQDKLKSLLDYKASAAKFSTLDNVYLSQFKRNDLDDNGKKILSELNSISSRTEMMMEYIEKLQNEYVVQLALKENITSPNTKNSILTPEAPISTFEKALIEGSKLSSKIINLASKLIMQTNSLVSIKVSNKANELRKLLLPLEQEAAKQGKKAFDLIGKVSPSGIHLIKRFDKEFWDKMEDAKTTEDKEYLKSIINKDTYNQLAKDYLDRNIDEINKTVFSSDFEKNEGIRQSRIKKLNNSINLDSKEFNGYKSFQFSHLLNQSIDEEKFYSKEFREMRKNEAAFKVWEFFTDLNKRAKDMGYLNKQGSSFLPLIEASILQKFSNTESILKESASFAKDLYTLRDNEQNSFSKIDPETGEVRRELPKFFTSTNKDVKQLSTDLNKMGVLWIQALEQFEANKNLEATLDVLHSVEKAKGSLILEGNKVKFDELGNLEVNKTENKNADILRAIMDDALYNIEQDLNSIGNITIASAAGKVIKNEERAQEKVVSLKKGLSTADTLVKALAVGLKPLIGAANYMGYNFQAFINNGDMYTNQEFRRNSAKITAGVVLSTKEKALLDYILPLNEDVSEIKRRQIAKDQGILNHLSEFSFTDVMMATNSFPERLLEWANAKSFLDNTMIKDGQLINIRQQLKREDSIKKYAKDSNGNLKMSNAERKELESTFNERVKQLKEKEALIHKVEFKDGEITIPGVSDEELAKFRTKVIEYGRNLSGQMNPDNKAGFRRDTMLNSFMMFKGWIPKQVHVRTMDLRKNPELDSWEYGRGRAFIKTWSKLGFKNILQLRHIVNGTEEGLKILDEMLAEKKEEYYKKTGQELEITEEEFYDVMRTAISNQFKELGLLLGLMGLFLAAKAARPPKDATLAKKNNYKFWMKLVNKTVEEVSFYYNPVSANSMTKGSIIPALGLLDKVARIFDSVADEGYGRITNDQELLDKTHPTKQFLSIIPVGSQVFSEVMPYLTPDLYKEMGGTVTAESRRQ